MEKDTNEDGATTFMSCVSCKMRFHLSASNYFPSDMYFEGGNHGTISYSQVDESNFIFQEDDKCGCFFETWDSWGIHRMRTSIRCKKCSALLGYVLFDGPPTEGGVGQGGSGPSQFTPRVKRYRFKKSAISNFE